MWDTVEVALDPEAHLLVFSTSLDISGQRPDALPAGLRTEVLARYPRLGLGEEFLACFRNQAERKPDSSAAASVRQGIAARISANPLDAHGV
ncbi:hypothetical protein [Streptomyces nigrescens]|uniref:hypothetical protein n=1 Tax=Streptomyces nigrescens TaxID=1920 RepID=UPI0036FD95BC